MMLETCFGTLAEIYEASVGCVSVLWHKKKKNKKINKNENKERKLNSRLWGD